MRKQLKNGNFYLALAGLMMLILFISSSMTYQQQSQVSLIQKYLAHEPLKETLNRISFDYAGSEISLSATGYDKFIEFFIRKAAHFMTYFVLGGSLYLGLSPKLKQKSSVLSLFFAWLAATGYAAIDEFHQMLTGGRTPLFQDVMLDASGALTACVLILMYQMIRKKR
ncbi:VanZ family protein [Enterococcus xiangfangensis]|uniref:VanZ family protein n=1 Tax=Enterococcus xiangfangensis TaxID=1296537 RepID=A0ABU3F7X1_9ENTE|nr:VanZ family protein [Enterococcus xiangfangensis]MBM7712101.1 VanZ family protein [Enterococcus xiangfangensis]MDT2758757.1 VanZ family protein [Enterococcus xiangfangensis]NBK08504.1 VanZ family protein [Enterococcus asini]